MRRMLDSCRGIRIQGAGSCSVMAETRIASVRTRLVERL